MNSPWRTARGGRVQRGEPLHFTFDGRRYTGLRGDTLASALLANGVHLLGRSFKYHRPRGILAAGSEEPNALVTVRRDAARCTPNLRATQVELYEGLEAQSQNRWPSLTLDVGSIAGLFSRFIPAGFYYKTFMWPRRAWKLVYEPLIRAAAGLGHTPRVPDPDRYTHRYAHCDVLIVGAGPAGLEAALAATRDGARVILCDEQAELGGSLLAAAETIIDGEPAERWLARRLEALRTSPNLTLLPRTTAFGYFAHNLVGLNERLTDHLAMPADGPRERMWEVRAKEVVLATGAIERPLVFPHNDRPGILLAEAARTYLARYGVLCGRRAVLATACDAAYQAAIDLYEAGASIGAIADLREVADGELPNAARAAGLPVHTGTRVVRAYGHLRVHAVQLESARGTFAVGCDLLMMSGGFTPSVHLFSQSRGTLRWDERTQAFLPDVPAERTRVVGVAALGVGELAPQPVHHDAPVSKAFVDWQNDVTVRDLLLATREGFVSVEHVKRYTTAGMATDQGKTSNLNTLAILGAALTRPIPAVGLTTFRMPYTPVTFGSFAGLERAQMFDPVRTTALHEWVRAHGAVFEDVGQWKRARYFPEDGETMQEAVARECRAVRRGCGMFDASTLGKIEVVGRDAAQFLHRFYVNALAKLPLGRARYALLLREDGFIAEDGIVARIDESRFHVTTTTGGAARVLAMMEDYLQTEWPDLEVWLTSTTEQWAVIAVQGPQARGVLQGLVEGIDLGKEALPHMSVADGRICGVPMRLFRVSFTGELGFEVNVPADFAPQVCEAIHAAGREFGIVVYGTETMHVLRAEKGYIIVGQDTDGTVTPQDVGLGWAIGKNKSDFVGQRSLARPAMSAPGRRQLVGLTTVDPRAQLEEGAQVIATGDQKPPLRPLGHVSSSYWSAHLQRSIALALIVDGRALLGQGLEVATRDARTAVQVTSPVFYDPDGARLHD